jgi:hypothetical protein
MDTSQDKPLLKKILSRYDQLGFIRKQIFEDPESKKTLQRLKVQSRKKIDEINRDFKDHEFKGPLTTLLQRYKLNKYQLIIILALLRQRLTSSEPCLLGRELLQMIFDDSYGILEGMSYIDSSSVLVSAGILLPEIEEDEEEEDLLESRFQLSDRVFSMIYKTFSPPSDKKENFLKKRDSSYANNMAFLMDMRKLSLIYQKRATKIFNYDYWDEIGLGVSESALGINRQLDLMRRQIQARLTQTDTKEKLFTLKFMEEYNLTEEEMVILVTLLFQELTEGNAYLNAVDLIRLTSHSEEDMVRNRNFFSARKNLAKHKLVQLEEMVNDKELTAEVCLPNWVMEKMLSGSDEKKGDIDVDARLDFHNYLKNLDSSEDFLDELED